MLRTIALWALAEWTKRGVIESLCPVAQELIDMYLQRVIKIFWISVDANTVGTGYWGDVMGNISRWIEEATKGGYSVDSFNLADSKVQINGVWYEIMLDYEWLHIGNFADPHLKNLKFDSKFIINESWIYEWKDVTIEVPGKEDTKVKKWVKLEGKEES